MKESKNVSSPYCLSLINNNAKEIWDKNKFFYQITFNL